MGDRFGPTWRRSGPPSRALGAKLTWQVRADRAGGAGGSQLAADGSRDAKKRRPMADASAVLRAVQPPAV